MPVIESIKAFFARPKRDGVAAAVPNRFRAASDAFDAAFAAIEPYTTRANHRYTILEARRDLLKAPSGDTEACDAYDEVIAAYTDPADHESYTGAYLDAHTSAIHNLTSAFHAFIAAFDAFSRADDLHPSAAAVYKATTDLYVFALDAYSNAAHCAMTTALEGNLQAAKDNFEVMLLETRAANATAVDAPAARAKAAAFKATAAENATAAKLLEQRATQAQIKADTIRATLASKEMSARESRIISDSQYRQS